MRSFGGRRFESLLGGGSFFSGFFFWGGGELGARQEILDGVIWRGKKGSGSGEILKGW